MVCVLQQGEDDIDCVGISVHVGCGLCAVVCLSVALRPQKLWVN